MVVKSFSRFITTIQLISDTAETQNGYLSYLEFYKIMEGKERLILITRDFLYGQSSFLFYDIK